MTEKDRVDTAGAAAALRRYGRLKEQATRIGTALAATLLSRRTVCGKPGCGCRTDPAQRHGPYWQLTWKEKGKTVTRRVPAEAVPILREWIANSRRWRRVLAGMESAARQAASALKPKDAARSEGVESRQN